MGWQTYLVGRVQGVENDLRHLDPAVRTHTDYIIAWAGVRDARILARLPAVPAELEPAWSADAHHPDPAAIPSGWNWWTGNQMERAYAALHRADAAYLALAPATVVRERAGEMYSQLPICGLHADDPRLPGYRAALHSVAFPTRTPAPPVSADTRVALGEISAAIDRESDGQHYRARTYRNLLFTTAIALLLVFLGMAVLASLNPGFFSLCSPAVGKQAASCPSGGASPAGSDVLLLGVAGMVGGAVGALILLLSVTVSSGPFTLATTQALLKLPAGAVISLVALFLMQHGTLGVLKAQSGDTLVGWAILFGVGQQAVTQAIDKRANAILSGAPPAKAGASGAASRA